jgi:hypothetical protein
MAGNIFMTAAGVVDPDMPDSTRQAAMDTFSRLNPMQQALVVTGGVMQNTAEGMRDLVGALVEDPGGTLSALGEELQSGGGLVMEGVQQLAQRLQEAPQRRPNLGLLRGRVGTLTPEEFERMPVRISVGQGGPGEPTEDPNIRGTAGQPPAPPGGSFQGTQPGASGERIPVSEGESQQPEVPPETQEGLDQLLRSRRDVTDINFAPGTGAIQNARTGEARFVGQD